jgi:O-antigen/teichoic acid export membrane protein
VLQGSAWILVGLGIQAVLGFAFWVLGARVASSAEVGRASALFTAIQFVNYASGLGLTVALGRHAVARSRESDALTTWAMAATAVSSVIGGCAYLALSDTSATALVKGSVAGWAVFCTYTVGTSIGLLVDVRMMAARRWGWLVGRITVVALVRLPLTALDVGVDSDLWLYHLMLAPLAIGGVVAVPLMAAIGVGRLRFARPIGLAAFARYAGVNWGAALSSQAPQYVLPLIVAQSVASSINASFFLAWTVTGLVFLVPAAISQVLLVEGARAADGVGDGADADDADGGASAKGRDAVESVPADATVPDPEGADRRAAEALGFSLGLAVVAWVGALVVAPVLAAVFGDDFDRLARYLPALMVAGIPWAVTSVRLTQARIRKDQVATVLITLTLGLGILVPAVVWVPSEGAPAAISAWVFGNVAAAIVAVVVHRRAGRRSVREGAAAVSPS